MFKKFLLGLFMSSVLFSSIAIECKNYDSQEVKDYLFKELGLKNIEKVSKLDDFYYEVIFKANGRKIPLYVDCNLKYLISGELIDIKNKKNVTRERILQFQMELSKAKEKELISVLGKDKFEILKSSFPGKLSGFSVVSLKDVPVEGLITLGNKNANRIVYILTDPECPYCARLHNNIEKVINERNDVQFKVIFYPLPFHKNAKDLSSAVICSKDPAMLSIIFKSQGNASAIEKFSSMKCKDGDKILSKHIEFGNNIGIRGTPTIILGNGLKISGALSKEDLIKLIDLL